MSQAQSQPRFRRGVAMRSLFGTAPRVRDPQQSGGRRLKSYIRPSCAEGTSAAGWPLPLTPLRPHVLRHEIALAGVRGMHHLIHGVVALQQLQRAALAEDGTQRLVLASEGQPHQPVPAAQMRYFSVRGSTAPSQKLPCFTAQICSATTLMMTRQAVAACHWYACRMACLRHETHATRHAPLE